MADQRRVRQPEVFDRFRCIGAACEDTCCAGWGIVIDRETYAKYQNLPAHRIADRPLIDLVEISPAGSPPGDYARFRMREARCPALHEGLCSIQRTLGEPYIPNLCSTYPRVLSVINGVVERSLQLSCPEAARLVLTNPEAMIFHEGTEAELLHRDGSLIPVAGDPDDCVTRVRALMIEMIQDRSLPLWQRILSLGFAVEKLAGVDMTHAAAILERGSFDHLSRAYKPDATFQLETVLELVVTRIGSDYTSPRFLECYRDFMLGLGWTAESTMEELAARYSIASESYFLPFIGSHEHLLENYLVSYIFRTVFPYRSRLPEKQSAIDSSPESMKHALVLLAVHYAIIRTVLIGMAALHKNSLSADHAVKLVQSYSKAFLHSTAFEGAAIQYLEKNAGDATRGLAQLVMD